MNGTRIASPTPLREGDEVQIGDYRIVLRGEQQQSIVDRPTMPSMPAITAPLATVGGAVAIPGRASVAAMAAQRRGTAGRGGGRSGARARARGHGGSSAASAGEDLAALAHGGARAPRGGA